MNSTLECVGCPLRIDPTEGHEVDLVLRGSAFVETQIAVTLRSGVEGITLDAEALAQWRDSGFDCLEDDIDVPRQWGCRVLPEDAVLTVPLAVAVPASAEIACGSYCGEVVLDWVAEGGPREVTVVRIEQAE